MSKNMLFKVVVVLCFLAVAVVWLLSALNIIQVNMSWVIAVFAFVLGGAFIIKGFVSKNVGLLKKLNILFGSALVGAGVFALVGTFIDGAIALPIIAIVLIVAILLCILATGGKKWDQADNENVGYKNYWERKKEQEEKEKEE